MGFNVNLYTFSKKVNSTARPTAAPVTHICIIKEPCGILNPRIGLNLGLVNNPSAYNYAYIPTFNRYYYIREWTFENALWYASLEVDTLATWKTQIGVSTCYVLRSAQEYNGAILDTTYPATGASTYDESQLSQSPWITDDIINGIFVVGVAGQNTTYYLFTYDALQLFFDYLFSDVYAADLTDNWSVIYPQLKAQTNPLQYITSIMWMPFITTGTDVSSIRVGWVDVPVAAWRVDGSGLRYGQADFSIRRHPQSGRGSYLNNAPYSSYNLFYPPWGTIPLDPDLVANSNTISAIWGVDLRTGQGTLTIGCGNGETVEHIMSWTHSQVGLHYQVSQVVNKGYGIGNTFAPVMSALTSAAVGNLVGAATGAISSTVSQIGDFAASKIPSATTIGSNGGMDSLRGTPALQYEWKNVVSEDNNHRGRPLCENRRIDTLSGFIMVSDADINLSATQEEQSSVRAHLEGGFFYE